MISPWMGDRYTLQNPQSFTSVANVHSTAHHRLYNDGEIDLAFCIQVYHRLYNDGEIDLAFCIQVYHRLYNDGEFDLAFCIQVCTMTVSLTWRFVYRYITGMYNDGEFDLAFCIQVCTMTVSLTWRFVYRYITSCTMMVSLTWRFVYRYMYIISTMQYLPEHELRRPNHIHRIPVVVYPVDDPGPSACAQKHLQNHTFQAN